MNIQQIQVVYDPLQDRIVMQVRTDQELVYGVWLTRRMALPLVPSFQQSLQTLAAQRQAPGAVATPEARAMLAQAAREQAAKSADYATPFDASTARRPWGDALMLPAQAEIVSIPSGQAVLRLRDPAGGTFEVQMGEELAIGMLNLLEAALKQSDWLPGPDVTQGAEASAPLSAPPKSSLN